MPATAGAPGAQQSLERLVADGEQPAIARATALSLLANFAPPPTDEAVRAGVGDDWALVRRAAAHALSNTDPAASANALAPLLSDPVRAVRIEAAEVLAGLPASNLPANVAAAFNRATDEYISSQQLNADRPEAHMNLGLLYARAESLRPSGAGTQDRVVARPELCAGSRQPCRPLSRAEPG